MWLVRSSGSHQNQSLPWEDHASVMISELGLGQLAAYYNMTTYFYEYPAVSKGRRFLLEVSPHHSEKVSKDGSNVVDARWIDLENGLFLDIMTARYDPSRPRREGLMACKDGKEFKVCKSTGPVESC